MDDDLIAQKEFIGLSVVDSIHAATLTAHCLLRTNLPCTIAVVSVMMELAVCQEPKQVLQNKFLARRAELIIHIAMAMPLI